MQIKLFPLEKRCRWRLTATSFPAEIYHYSAKLSSSPLQYSLDKFWEILFVDRAIGSRQDGLHQLAPFHSAAARRHVYTATHNCQPIKEVLILSVPYIKLTVMIPDKLCTSTWRNYQLKQNKVAYISCFYKYIEWTMFLSRPLWQHWLVASARGLCTLQVASHGILKHFHWCFIV